MTTKAQQARDLYRQGLKPSAIAKQIPMPIDQVKRALVADPNRKNDPRTWAHMVTQKWVGNSKVPTGRCLKWIPEKGDYCGAKCVGQRCEEHKETNPAFNTVSTKFQEIAA